MRQIVQHTIHCVKYFLHNILHLLIFSFNGEEDIVSMKKAKKAKEEKMEAAEAVATAEKPANIVSGFFGCSELLCVKIIVYIFRFQGNFGYFSGCVLNK